MSQFVIKSKGSEVAIITNDREAAAWLMANSAKHPAPKGQKVLVYNKATGFGTHTDLPTAAILLGLSVNAGPSGKCIVWENHQLVFVNDNGERAVICSTTVPAPKSMYGFLKPAAKQAGVDDTDLARMFPKPRERTLVANPAPDPEPAEEAAAEPMPAAAE